MQDEIQKTESDDQLLSLARSRFSEAEEFEQDIRLLALDDLKFRAGEQWPAYIKNQRDLDNRPTLVINKIPQFVRQITNEQRQNRPSIKVSPVDSKSDVDTAKIYEGLVRHIQVNSNADVAYDTAFENAVTQSFGYFRVITDFCDPMSFEQEILIKQIPDAFSVYLDPAAIEPDGSDANWAFVFKEMSKDEFKALYPNAEISNMADWTSTGDMVDWRNNAKVRVAEYFYKEFKKAIIVKTVDGSVVEKSKLPEGFPVQYIVEEREALLSSIKWIKFNGDQVLEKTDWLGRWIPIIPVYGAVMTIEGRKIIEGIVRNAKDPQRMYNYWTSSETESIALAPKAPFIAAEGQITPEFEPFWKSANVKSHAYLPYKAMTVDGVIVPPPQRNAYEPPIAAITNARAQSNDDLKATTGIYDASLGNRSNEQSGIAIQRRNMQSQTSNFHFIDNLTRALKHCGKILVDLIPKIYDTERTVRIIGEDGTEEIVKINQIFQEKNGEVKNYQLNVGKYDVVVEVGPSYATKRQESAAMLLEFAKTIPQQAPMISDLIAGNLDFPNADILSERLVKLLPAGLVEDKDKPPVPQEVQVQIQQMNQMIEQLTASLNKANEETNNKKIEIESKERIEFAKLENQMQIEIAKINHAEAMAAMNEGLRMDQARLSELNMDKEIIDESGSNNAAAVEGDQNNGEMQ